jgi:hypothetical protein
MRLTSTSRTLALVAFLLMLLAPRNAAAQPVRGSVVDTLGRPLPEADVIVVNTQISVRTDAGGRFALPLERAGTYEIRVRKIGYISFGASFYFRPGMAEELVLVMTQFSNTLDTVRAIADADRCATTTLEGFECRRQAGLGYFRDAGTLRSLRSDHWADMFEGMPGLRRNMVLGPMGREWRIMARPSRCLVELWNGQPPMLAQPGDFPPDMRWRPNDVVAIEYYDEFYKVPARYRSYVLVAGEQPCELVIYWLRGATKRD